MIISCWAIDIIGEKGHETFYAYRRGDSELYDYAGDIDGDHGIGVLASIIKDYRGVPCNEVSPICSPNAEYISVGFDAFQSMLGCRLRTRLLNSGELQDLLRFVNT